MEEKPTKRIVAKLKHPLPSYRISFEKHFEIIKAYVVASKEGKEPVGWKNFQKLVSMHPTLISANNKFFEDLGLIKEIEGKPGMYVPTEKAIEFSKVKDWNEEEANNILRGFILNSWFWESANQLLNIRRTVDKGELINKLGFDSGADHQKHLPSLNVLVEYLKYVELIKEENGKVTYGKFGAEKAPSLQIKPAVGTEMVQIAFKDELFAIDIKELEIFLREKGKKIDRNVYRIK